MLFKSLRLLALSEVISRVLVEMWDTKHLYFILVFTQLVSLSKEVTLASGLHAMWITMHL